eukprot:7239611-Ditylum_brightwellii.AAC.1
MITKLPWIPQMHLEQMQKAMSAMAKLSTNYPALKQAMDGKDISPDVLRIINDTASDNKFSFNPHHFTKRDLLRIRMKVNRTRGRRPSTTATLRKLRRKRRQKRKDG